ncbi:S41 family peptidase [Duganella lactea]|nr:S41 family peptidase [Duganella lactea]
MKYLSSIVTAGAMALLAACGGGGGGGSSAPSTPATATAPATVPEYQALSNRCVAPRSGADWNGKAYSDKQGSLNDELRWVRSFIDETYLWYKEVPAGINMASYSNPLDYFAVLKTPATTASGRPKDAFHFTYPTQQWQMNQAGVTLGYGVTWYNRDTASSRLWGVALVEPGSPAAAAGVQRGDLLDSVDGVSINDMSGAGTAKLNAGLFPDVAGARHQLGLQRAGALLTVSLIASNVNEAPVQNTKVFNTPTGAVGYLQFNDHNDVAESALLQAFTTLKNANVNDLVLDMRYNGGGYLVVANQLAYMIAGPVATSGKVFDREVANDKRPVTAPSMFQSSSIGLSPALLSAGVSLPSLNLKRVTILTTPGTCSASEALINGLRGIDVEVNLVGGGTCGKPYGFYPEDNCGNTYFAIQLQVVNNKGDGDYADGFSPTCAVEDDFGHALGDPAERLLSAALNYRASGVCPAVRSARSLAAGNTDGNAPARLVRPGMKEIAVLHR